MCPVGAASVLDNMGLTPRFQPLACLVCRTEVDVLSGALHPPRPPPRSGLRSLSLTDNCLEDLGPAPAPAHGAAGGGGSSGGGISGGAGALAACSQSLTLLSVAGNRLTSLLALSGVGAAAAAAGGGGGAGAAAAAAARAGLPGGVSSGLGGACTALRVLDVSRNRLTSLEGIQVRAGVQEGCVRDVRRPTMPCWGRGRGAESAHTNTHTHTHMPRRAHDSMDPTIFVNTHTHAYGRFVFVF